MRKVLIVDDHPVVRYGMVQILEANADLNIKCEQASSSREAIQKLTDSEYQAVLLDVSLDGENGLDFLVQLHDLLPDLPVLIVSMHAEEQYAISAISLGAAGYLCKLSLPQTIIEAVSKVLSGKRYLTEALASRLADHFANGGNDFLSEHEKLSHRELQVLSKVGAGKTPTEISKELFLSVKTISTYRERILKKMGLRTTAEMMKYAITKGIVE